MKPPEAIRALAACPRPSCRAAIGASCATRAGRNHPERVNAALREALAQEGEARGMGATKQGHAVLRSLRTYWSRGGK